MPNDLLVKNVPPDVRGWIDFQTHERRITMKELLVTVLRGAARTDAKQQSLFDPPPPTPRADPSAMPFSFIDLFSGIGGLRLGLQAAGGRCIFSSEWDEPAQKTYATWFGEKPAGDITKIIPAEIPDHDVMAFLPDTFCWPLSKSLF